MLGGGGEEKAPHWLIKVREKDVLGARIGIINNGFVV